MTPLLCNVVGVVSVHEFPVGPHIDVGTAKPVLPTPDNHLPGVGELTTPAVRKLLEMTGDAPVNIPDHVGEMLVPVGPSTTYAEGNPYKTSNPAIGWDVGVGVGLATDVAMNDPVDEHAKFVMG
jgi:hypothetical protein